MTDEMIKISDGREIIDIYREAHAKLYTSKLSTQEISKRHKELQDKMLADIEKVGYKDQTKFWTANREYNDNATEGEAEELTILWS